VKLNRVEKALMNNPVRMAVQRTYETHLLMGLGGRMDGARVLEVGCGRGVGTRLIIERFGAAHVAAFDLDEDMVARARRRLARLEDRVKLSVGDVTAIDAPDKSFDAVFEFGIIHHVPDWRMALDEVERVLRPGGRFYFEEVTSHALRRWASRTFLEHPENDRFTAGAFVAALEERGIAVGQACVTLFFEDFLIGVGTKAAS
jgi:ubiquinone/menaquinone biosynthesis C-methylase UbiE